MAAKKKSRKTPPKDWQWAKPSGMESRSAKIDRRVVFSNTQALAEAAYKAEGKRRQMKSNAKKKGAR